MKKRKAPQKPFEIEMLPSSRKEQFFDLAKHRFFFFLGVGALLLGFSLPILGGAFFKDMGLINLSISSAGEEEQKASSYAIKLIAYAIQGLGFPFLGFGLAGILAPLKNLAWNDPLFFKDDFKSGLKENARSYVGIGFLWGLFYFLEGLIGLLFSNLPWFGAVLFGINLALVYPVLIASLFLTLYYSNPFAMTIQKGAAIYFRHFPLLFLSSLCLLLPLFSIYIPIFLVKYGVLILWMALIFPFAVLFSFELHLHYFDEDVNLRQFPDHYQKGLTSYYQGKQ